jgi:anti-sigma regulatory factor (Ser/Thr protein kinase)
MIESVVLDHDLSSARTGRRLAAHLLAGQDPDVIDRITLMVSELITNSVKHSKEPCSITFEITPELVRVEVRDAGATTPRPRAPLPDEPSGRGLQIVGTLSDDWGIESTSAGNMVWFEVELQPAPPARAERTTTEGTGDADDGAEDDTPVGATLRRQPPTSTPKCIRHRMVRLAVGRAGPAHGPSGRRCGLALRRTG